MRHNDSYLSMFVIIRREETPRYGVVKWGVSADSLQRPVPVEPRGKEFYPTLREARCHVNAGLTCHKPQAYERGIVIETWL